jgi:hypothetical protein
MQFLKTTAALLLLAGAALGLSACQSSAPQPAADEHAGHTKHVHADGSVHYH